MLITTRHYLLTTIFLACLVPTFILAPPAIRLWCLAGLVAIFASIATWFIPRQHHSLLTTRQVTKLCAILGLLYLALAYTSGLYTGFYRQTSILTPRQFFLTTIPTFLIIGCFELLRARLLSSRHTSFWTSLFCGVILDFFRALTFL